MSTDLAVQEREDQDVGVGDYQFGFHDPTDKYVFKSRRGLDREIVYQISEMKKEPKWMRDFRINSLETFFQKPMPHWGGDLEEIDFQNIFYYMKAAANLEKSWEDVPDDIRKTYDRLGIPEAEKKYLAGVKGAVRVGSHLRQLAGGPRQARGDLHRHRLGVARPSGPLQAVLRYDHSAE